MAGIQIVGQVVLNSIVCGDVYKVYELQFIWMKKVKKINIYEDNKGQILIYNPTGGNAYTT